MHKEWRPLGIFNNGSCMNLSCTKCPLAASSTICLSSYARKSYSTPTMTSEQVKDLAQGWEFTRYQGTIYIRNLRKNIPEQEADATKNALTLS